MREGGAYELFIQRGNLAGDHRDILGRVEMTYSDEKGFGYKSWDDLLKMGGSFVQTLAKLIPLADAQNLERIRWSFPHEVALYEYWMGVNDEGL